MIYHKVNLENLRKAYEVAVEDARYVWENECIYKRNRLEHCADDRPHLKAGIVIYKDEIHTLAELRHIYEIAVQEYIYCGTFISVIDDACDTKVFDLDECGYPRTESYTDEDGNFDEDGYNQRVTEINKWLEEEVRPELLENLAFKTFEEVRAEYEKSAAND